jgi:hypothetical protein
MWASVEIRMQLLQQKAEIELVLGMPVENHDSAP